jgi:hypothetical protein
MRPCFPRADFLRVGRSSSNIGTGCADISPVAYAEKNARIRETLLAENPPIPGNAF